MNFSYDNALLADEHNTLAEWVVEFLNTTGGNPKLAERLQKDGRFHTGLIDYPIDELKILLGTDESYLYYEDPEKYEQRVEAMVSELRKGWKPAPIIATDLWNDELTLADGAHRAEALKRIGVERYATVFYFQNQENLDLFLQSI